MHAVVEIDTSAASLCVQHVASPPFYKAAYFDLVSTGYVPGNAILLTLRFADKLDGFERLTLLLSERDLKAEPSVCGVPFSIDTARCC